MIVIGMLGDIGSGKSFVAKQFGCPVFSADYEVNEIYNKDKISFKKIKAALPKFIKSFPINKAELSNALLSNKRNLKKIIKIVHPIVRKKMDIFLKKNESKKMVILDIPLLIENKLNKKSHILIFVNTKRLLINSRLKKRKNYNKKILQNLRKNQVSTNKKKKLADYIIDNNFSPNIIKKKIRLLKKKIIDERNSSRY